MITSNHVKLREQSDFSWKYLSPQGEASYFIHCESPFYLIPSENIKVEKVNMIGNIYIQHPGKLRMAALGYEIKIDTLEQDACSTSCAEIIPLNHSFPVIPLPGIINWRRGP